MSTTFNMEYDEGQIDPVQGAFYAASTYGEAHFNYFREERAAELTGVLLPLANDTEDAVLTDTNLVSIKGTPGFELANYLGHFKMMAEKRKTTMGHITLDHLRQSAVVTPPLPLIKQMDDSLRPIFDPGQQLFKLFLHFGLDPSTTLAGTELRAWDDRPVYANTRERSLLGSLNRYKFEAWNHFAYGDRSLPDVAARQWEGLFRHPSLAAPGRPYGYDAWKRPLNLVYERLIADDMSQSITLSANRNLH